MHIRSATIEDADFLWQLQQDPTVQAMSGSTGPASYDAHLAWLEQALLDQWFMIGYEERPLGYVRVNQAGYVSVALVAEARGRGLGLALLDLAAASQDRNLIALIKAENGTSARLFARAGYRYDGQEDGCWRYVYPHR